MSGYEKYYVPDQSKLPIYAAFSMFVLIMGAAGTINAVGTEDSISKYVLYFFRYSLNFFSVKFLNSSKLQFAFGDITKGNGLTLIT